MTPEKLLNFLISDEFYSQFLSIVNNFGIKSDENFIKFVEVNKFFDSWFRENWSQEESYLKAKEIMTNFSDEEIAQILDFINKNFNKQREALWQSESKVEDLESMDEKERRYLEIMSTLVKFPEANPERKVAKEEPTIVESRLESESVSVSQPKPKQLNLEDGLRSEINSEENLKIQEDIKSRSESVEIEHSLSESDVTVGEESSSITTANFELETKEQEEPQQTFDNIVISYKKEEEKKSEEDEKFLDLSNL